MRKCQRKGCGSTRVADVSAKCSDLCSLSVGGCCHDGYVLSDMGVGSGDYIELSYCLECGQIQDNFPLKPTALEQNMVEE